VSRLWHRIQHWFRLEPCRNYTEWRGDVLWHYMVCVKCGQRVLEFESRIRR